MAVGGGFRGSAAQRQNDSATGKAVGQGKCFLLAEVRLAVPREDVRDRKAGPLGDRIVEIDEGPTEGGWPAGGREWSCPSP